MAPPWTLAWRLRAWAPPWGTRGALALLPLLLALLPPAQLVPVPVLMTGLPLTMGLPQQAQSLMGPVLRDGRALLAAVMAVLTGAVPVPASQPALTLAPALVMGPHRAVLVRMPALVLLVPRVAMV